MMKNLVNSRGSAIFFLTFITAIWGWSFVIVKESISCYPVFSFLGVRFLFGATFLLPFLIFKKNSINKKVIKSGIFLGFLLFLGYSFQTTGLIFTTPSHSGFITGLFVVFTPLLETIFFKRRVNILILISLFLSTSGLFFVSFDPNIKGLNFGDFLSLICALIYSFHLLFLDRYSKMHNSLLLAFFQILSVSFFSFIVAFIMKSPLYPIPSLAFKGIILTSLFATSLSYFIQTKYQSLTTATQAALIFTMEPVFAGIFSYFLYDELFYFRTILGGLLILSGMVVSQLRVPIENKEDNVAVD